MYTLPLPSLHGDSQFHLSSLDSAANASWHAYPMSSALRGLAALEMPLQHEEIHPAARAEVGMSLRTVYHYPWVTSWQAYAVDCGRWRTPTLRFLVYNTTVTRCLGYNSDRTAAWPLAISSPRLLACWASSRRCINSWARVTGVVALYRTKPSAACVRMTWKDLPPHNKSAAPYATRASPLYSRVPHIGADVLDWGLLEDCAFGRKVLPPYSTSLEVRSPPMIGLRPR